MIEKGVITPTTYTFNDTTESNGYISAKSKSNGLSPNSLTTATPSSESLGKLNQSSLDF